MVKRLFASLFVMLSLSAHAGYFATVTERPNTYFKALGTSSTCFLTVSMAVANLSIGASATVVTNIDSSLLTWSAYYSQPQFYANGSFSTCDVVPQGGPMPAFAGSVSDPGLVSGGVAIGGGSSLGSLEEMEALFGWNTELFEMAVSSSLLVFAIGFGVGLIVNIVRKSRNF